MDVAAIRQGLADALETIPDLNIYSYTEPAASPPAAMVGFPDVAYLSTMQRGYHEMEIPVVVLLANVVSRDTAAKASAYLSQPDDRSIVDAVWADKMLGGTCDSVSVTSAEVQESGSPDQVRIVFTVKVAATGGA